MAKVDDTIDTRAKGLLKFIVSGLLGVIAIYLFAQGNRVENSVAGPVKLIAVATPGAYALVGFLELVTGVPFGKLAASWDSLKGWQRSVIGIVVAAAAFAALIVGIVLFA